MSRKVGVISDTHGILRPEVLDILRTCDHIVHAGDFDNGSVLEELEDIAPVTAVRGNNDWSSWASRLPRQLTFTLDGVKCTMAHKREDVSWDLQGVQLVVFGHSHQYFEEQIHGRLWLNPGSCGPRRFRLSATMMVLTLDPKERRVEVEKISLVSQKPVAAPAGTPTGQDLYEAVGVIVKEIQARRDVADIAARHRLDEKFVERVCRIYLTHPGVDMDGIMNRLL